MTQYTDQFGNPIDVGSVVTYTTLNYKSAYQNFAVVEKLIPLVESPGQWHSTGPNSRVPFHREDQLNNSRPTDFYVACDTKGNPLPEKLYVAQVRPLKHLGEGYFKRYMSKRLGTQTASGLIVIDAVTRGVDE